MNYADYEYMLSASLLVCAMFGMGATLTAHDFVGVLRAPQGIVAILVLQVLGTPLLSLGVAWVLDVPREIVVGMLVYAALPGGLFSNIITYLGRGNVALSVSATSVCSLACLATTTFVLKTFGATQLPDDFAMPTGYILFEIGLCLLLPLTLGMVFRRSFPRRYALVARLCVRTSMVLLALVVVGALVAGRIHPAAYGWRTPIALILVQAFMLWLTYATNWLLRLSRNDSFAVSIEVIIRNSHLGVLLKAALFPSHSGAGNAVGDAVLFVVLFAGFASIVIGLGETIGKRRGWGVYGEKQSEPAREPES